MSATPQKRNRTDHYLKLVNAFPLKPIRTDAQYAQAGAVMAKLAVQPEGSLDPGEQDYLDALTLMIEAFDREHVRLVQG